MRCSATTRSATSASRDSCPSHDDVDAPRRLKEEKLAELAKKKAIDDESSLMTGEDYSLEDQETPEEREAREARELQERIEWEESERLRIEQERIDDEHFRRGQAEAKQASVSLLARNFYFSIKDEVRDSVSVSERFRTSSRVDGVMTPSS